MPKWIIYLLVTSVFVAMIPPAAIVRARFSRTSKPRIHYIQDMDNQASFAAQSIPAAMDNGSPFFMDGRAMRQPVTGTVARGELAPDEHFNAGTDRGGWATTFPAQTRVDVPFIEFGRERFEIYCTPCHGAAGYGDGIVNQRATELLDNPFISNGTTWVAPKNIHEPEIRDQPVGQLYNTITNGVRNMAGYAAQIPVEDRWAIVAYVKALHLSQYANDARVNLESVVGTNPSNLPLVDLVPKETGPEETN